MTNLEYITNIGDEMARQDNRATQYPLFVIEVDDKQYVNYHDDYDGVERNYDTEDGLCRSCDDLQDEGKDLPEKCDDCPTSAFYYYKQIKRFELMPGVFFTAKACQQHIDENKYHYNNPRTYGISAWRNPEMQLVQKLILNTANQDVPSYYQ